MSRMRRDVAFALFLFVIALAATHSLAQQRYDSGPFKGFLKEEPTLNVKELPRSFEVRAIRGALIFGEHALPEAFFEVRDANGHVFTAKTDEHGAFTFPDARAGRYDFKATKNGFESVVGTVIVSDSAPKKNRIRVQLSLGT